MKISDYEKVQDLHDADAFLVDGDRGTKTILTTHLAKQIFSRIGSKELLDKATPSALPEDTQLEPYDLITVQTGDGMRKATYETFLNGVDALPKTSDEYFNFLDVFADWTIRKSVLRNKKLNMTDLTSLLPKIAENDFKGLFIGDYWIGTGDGIFAGKPWTGVIADFNTGSYWGSYYNLTDRVASPHLCLLLYSLNGETGSGNTYSIYHSSDLDRFPDDQRTICNSTIFNSLATNGNDSYKLYERFMTLILGQEWSNNKSHVRKTELKYKVNPSSLAIKTSPFILPSLEMMGGYGRLISSNSMIPRTEFLSPIKNVYENAHNISLISKYPQFLFKPTIKTLETNSSTSNMGTILRNELYTTSDVWQFFRISGANYGNLPYIDMYMTVSTAAVAVTTYTFLC